MTDKPIALITGGAQGIGYACAEAIAEDGARIVLADINADGAQAAAATLGGDTVAFACDMGDADQVTALFDRIEAEIGTVSIVRVLRSRTISSRHRWKNLRLSSTSTWSAPLLRSSGRPNP